MSENDSLNNGFAIGQRYLSDTESELGLGVVVLVDERCVHILFPQSEETRVYAKSSAPLSRVVFKAGDTITDQDGNIWIVTEAQSTNGVYKYAVQGQDGTTQERPIMETRLAANINLAKPLERLLASRVHHNDWYELRQEVLKTQGLLASHPLKGLMGARVDIIEHQLYIAHEVGKRIAPRVLLADEVGLGKTIEAGLIIHQQLLTGKAERILILVPDSLQYQWMIELRRRFNLEFSIFDLVRTAAIAEHDPEQNPFLTEQHIIASTDLFLDHAGLFAQALEAGFDLLVVDEAHHLHWDSEQGGNDKYNMVDEFAKQTAGVLLLTATPEQLGLESHFARLRLLDPNRFADLDEFIESEENFTQIASIVEVLLGENELSEKQKTALSSLLGHPISDDQKGRQQAINELLDRHGTGRVLFRNTRESVAELILGFQGRTSISYPLALPDSWQDTYRTHGKLREQLWSEELQPDGSWLEEDPRVVWLIHLLKNELKHQKVLLVARSGATVESLEAVLRLHAGIKTAIFTEQMSLLERDQAAAYFADNEGAQILLCSEIGSEGRNFQFASHLVLFDLPANPDTLEQRIGRLDRIGQQHQITIHVPYVQGTATERLYHWYHEALNIFSQISPTAQTVQEQFIVELKPLLEGQGTQAELEKLINQGKEQRLAFEENLQQGRDRLLEYNSCRPRVAGRIASAMREFDDTNKLPLFFERFMSSINMEYSGQRDGSLMLHPSDEVQLSGLAIPEDGMTLTFERDQALVREDMAFMTYEHPLMQSIFESVHSGTFGNTTVATLQSNSMPEGMLLVEVNFRIEAIAPKLLNLPAYLPTPLIRVFLTQQGTDFSQKISSDAIRSHIHRLDKAKARHVIKARKDVIEARYYQAENLAKSQLEAISQEAQARFGGRWQREIERLQYLQRINPNVRDSEITALERLHEQGMTALGQLAVVPDSIRVLVTVKLSYREE